MATQTPVDTFKRVLAATTKALAGKTELEVQFGGEVAGLVKSGDVDHLVLPMPPTQPTQVAIAKSRGQADALALKLALHDPDIFAKDLPRPGPARAICEALEQARVESLGAKFMEGVSDNLHAALDARCIRRGFHQDGLSQDDTPMAEAMGLIAREVFSGRALPDGANGIMQAWRDHIETTGSEALDNLADNLDDQVEFAKYTQELLKAFDLGDELSDAEQGDEDEDDESRQDEDNNPQNAQEEQEEQDPGSAQVSEADALDDDETDASDTVDADDIDGDSTESDEATEQEGRRPEFSNAPTPYSVYTRAHDEVIKAEELCEIEELTRLRTYLDGHMAGLSAVIARLANRLQRRLLAQQQRSWNFDLEEGILDTARLTRVVTDPMQALSFKEEEATEFRDTVVTILIDNSGSMRGRPIMMAAVCADILARTLERCAVKAEILGFTTRAWKGGASFQDWLAAGKPDHPGRLNDLRHIIYKSADMPWRRAKHNLGLMMREGLLKENIDGEALEWAFGRLMARPEQRRILMVISDGAPVDDATQSRNRSGMLENHLHQVIDKIENRSEVELIAIGINHDVTRWYQHAVTITDVEELGGVMTEKLAELFADKSKTTRRRRR
ncbi:MAG: cobaltochelatase subunit CobT [Acidimicrobiales bacterium]|nr:cobaltochelatase subunit CobT [Hyphomonadaceae bacterium]RZV40953.1 MAG: cobaltochelatase subunit CobT [Acidimicrobiales bacterium]